MLAVAGALALAGTSCPRTPSTSVLVISIDSLRYDHVHGNGYGRDTTPVLDRIAREGTVWTGAIAPAPWTTPSMMSVMTGLDADLHHVDEDDRMIHEQAAMLAERFRSQGYATAAFVPSATLTARFGFSRGFDLYDERDFGHRTVTSAAQASSVIHWLERTPGPFFGWVHLWDPHYNYNPPAPYDARFLPPSWQGRPPPASAGKVIEMKNTRTDLPPEEIEYLISQYDGEVAYADRYVGEILGALREAGRLDRTLVVVLGDHGEAFQEHGWLTHTNTVYEETVRVPLMARLPGLLAAGRRIEGPCSLTGLSGSIGAWAGLPAVRTPGPFLPDGNPRPEVSLDGPPPASTPVVVSMTRRQATILSARIGRWSLLLDYDACRFELYDLTTDPTQHRDLAASRPEILSAARACLEEYLTAMRREHAVPIRRLEDADPELFEKLGALGYADLFGDRLGKRSTADPLHCL